MLENQPDFKNQKPFVKAVEAVGGKVLFGVKFTTEVRYDHHIIMLN